MAPSEHHDLSHEDVQKVIASVDIPACPGVVTDAMREAQKDEPDIKRLADVISGDPGMSAAALKLANSPLFGSGAQISSVRKAVERLGTKNIVCVVVAAALRASVTGLPAAWLEEFWRRTTQMAVTASMIARKQYGISPDAAYTYTLFHDAAIPLMMKRFPEYAKVLENCEQEKKMRISVEAALFPCTHPIVGSLLVRNWGLPPILGQAIRFHHEDDAYDLPDRTLPGGALSFIAVTHVAEHLFAETQGEPDLEVGEILFNRALEHLGISADDLDSIRELVALTAAETA